MGRDRESSVNRGCRSVNGRYLIGVTALVLTLLDYPSAALRGGPPAPLGLKTVGLLAYLALEPGPHAREALATLLWSDAGDEDARASLRQALRQLRAAFGDAVIADRQFVRLAEAPDCDVLRFLAAARTDARAAAGFDVNRFFRGAAIRQAPAFEEWLSGTRDRLLRLSLDALRDEARAAVSRSRWHDALALADRWLAADPADQDAMAVAVEAEYCVRGRSVALRRYGSLRTQLERETGAVPGPELAELARRIDRAPETAAPATDADIPSALDFHADLIGREAQWSALQDAWQALGTTGDRVVLIEGEAGMGKTRLAEEFTRWAGARGGTILRGEGYEPSGGPPFGTVAGALRQALGAPGVAGADAEWLAEVARLLPELRHQFAGLPAPAPAPAGMERWRLFEGVAQLLLALAAERSVALFIDDLQWCDGESCTLLQFLVRRLAEAPVLFIATVTTGEAEAGSAPHRLTRMLLRRGARRLPLQPLSEEEVWQLVRRMGNIRAPAGGRRFARRLFGVSDGNPFQVIEVAKMLFAEGVLGATPVSREWVLPANRASGEHSRLEVPRSVRDAIGLRVSRLPDELRQILASIAVAARPVGADVLAHVHGISRLRLAAMADALMERQLVVEERESYRMAHPSLGQAVRAGLSSARRREVHRALSLAFEASAETEAVAERAGEIARHAERAGEAARARRFALLASDAALAQLAFDEALASLELARRAAPDRAGEIDARVAALAERAGWTSPPSTPFDTASRPLTPEDLDLRPADLAGAESTRSSS